MIHQSLCVSHSTKNPGDTVVMCDCVKTYYDYSQARGFCKGQGMVFMEAWLPDIDRSFYVLELTQEQVDQLMVEYIWRVKWLFTPGNYSLKERAKLALHFLFG